MTRSKEAFLLDDRRTVPVCLSDGDTVPVEEGEFGRETPKQLTG